MVNSKDEQFCRGEEMDLASKMRWESLQNLKTEVENMMQTHEERKEYTRVELAKEKTGWKEMRDSLAQSVRGLVARNTFLISDREQVLGNTPPCVQVREYLMIFRVQPI